MVNVLLPETDPARIAQEEQRSEGILLNLGRTWADCFGKRILDVGSGSEEVLSRSGWRRGIEVTSVDIVLPADIKLRAFALLFHGTHVGLRVTNMERDTRDFVRMLLAIDGHYQLTDKTGEEAVDAVIAAAHPVFSPRFVEGRAESLPFPDHTFDLVLSHGAPPTTWTETAAQAMSVMQEAIRVTKVGGEYRFGPTAISSAALFPDMPPRILTPDELKQIPDRSLACARSFAANARMEQHPLDERWMHFVLPKD